MKMFLPKLCILFALLVPSMAVVNSKSDTKIERREAPFDTYGPPPQQQQHPVAVYGAPAVNSYPPPPPPVSQEYGVPVLRYGPPKVQIEYGPPIQGQQSYQQQHHHHHQPQQQFHRPPSNELSFLDQIKNSLGFSSSQSSHRPSHGLSQHKPHTSYGPPAPVNHYLPPKPHSKYGPPPKPHNTYGPPPTKPQLTYGVPSKPSVSYIPAANHIPSATYGLPSKPAINFNKPSRPIRPPVPVYGPPQQGGYAQSSAPPSSYGPPSSGFGGIGLHPAPSNTYGVPSSQYGPPKNSGPLPVRCDGWKPIPGPSIHPLPNNIGSSIQSVLPDNSYLPPGNSLALAADTHVEQSAHVGDDLQLPIAEAGNFLADNSLGLGITSFDVIKSNGIELHPNQLDSYSAPPPDSFGPNYQSRRPVSNLRLPSNSYSISSSYGPPPPPGPYPSSTYGVPSSGLGIQHGSVTGNLKQWPASHLHPPRQPVAFRPPVPAGLIESIGHSVQHQDTFGVQLPQQGIYLPPPTGEIPPPPHGLETLPLAPALPFNNNLNLNIHQDLQSIQPRYPSECSHGPNLGSGHSIQIPQLQSIYGVPNTPLEISQSGFEIAQNTAQSNNLLTSYGPPASGSFGVSTSIGVSEVHEPSSSYGPPPSGNPADSLAYSSQKSTSTVQIDSAGATSNVHETQQQQTQSQSQSETRSQLQSDGQQSESEKNEVTKVEDLPGISGTGLDIISAQQSQTVEIPVQGQLGSYSLQFQAADPLASQNNQLDSPDHQKLLSEGLLQSILSAIEQPKQQNVRQTNDDENLNHHRDVEEFVNSQAGQETLGEPKTE